MHGDQRRSLASAGGGCALALVCLFALALPGWSAAGWAAAAPATPARIASGHFRSWLYPNSVEVLLHGTHGYRVTIFATPLPAKKVTVYLTKGSEEVTYTAPGSATDAGIKASLGPLGRIEGTFRPSPTVRNVRVSRDCTTNRPPVISPRLADFVGTVAIRGEGGFTEATRSPDGAPPRAKAECAAVKRLASAGSVGETVGLLAGDKDGGGLTLFAAAQGPIIALWPRPPAPAAPDGSFSASVSSSAGRVSVERIVEVPAGPGQFSFDPSFASALVTPPAPFTGSAEFRREAGGRAGWTGDLAVGFAGIGSVPLTGSGFGAALGKGSELITVDE